MDMCHIEMCLWCWLLLLRAFLPTGASRIWKTLYMDSHHDCAGTVLNDGMEEGDYYKVNSDSNDGSPQGSQRPAECAIGFNFGDRLIGLEFKHWQCDRDNKDPYLGIYNDCNAGRQNVVLQLNCTTPPPSVLRLEGHCLSLYHYRGHTQRGYYFSLHITAKKELIAFPAGNIAAIIVGIIVLLMVLVKIMCVISGFERRLPDIYINEEEQKRLFQSFTDPLLQSQPPSDGEAQAGPSSSGGATACGPPAGGTMLLTAGRGHRVLRVSRSTGSATSGGSRSSEHDYDYFDIHVEGPTEPRLKRFPSVRASSFLRH